MGLKLNIFIEMYKINARQKLKRGKKDKKKTPSVDEVFYWLGNRDLNPNKQSQSLSCYRYTIPQCNAQVGYGLLLYTLLSKCQHLFQKKSNFFCKIFAVLLIL